jgi:hypothetical protein
MGDSSVQATLANVQRMQQQLAAQQEELRRLRLVVEGPDDEADDATPDRDDQ